MRLGLGSCLCPVKLNLRSWLLRQGEPILDHLPGRCSRVQLYNKWKMCYLAFVLSEELQEQIGENWKFYSNLNCTQEHTRL